MLVPLAGKSVPDFALSGEDTPFDRALLGDGSRAKVACRDAVLTLYQVDILNTVVQASCEPLVELAYFYELGLQDMAVAIAWLRVKDRERLERFLVY